jgi:transcriptional regulator with XRE-family HTH domain
MSIPEITLDTNEIGGYAKMYSMENNNLDFTEWLVGERKRRGWSQADLARAAGISRGAVSNIERGERGTGIEVLTAIAGALRLPPDVVLGRAGKLPQQPAGDELLATITHLASQLDELSRREAIQMLELILERQRQREPLEMLQAALDALPETGDDQAIDLVLSWLQRAGFAVRRVR